MHPNPIYHDADRAQNLDFARTRAFGVLAVSTAEAPLISHVPFLLSEDGTSADLHLVRSNPITRVLKTPQAARLAVSGPDGYVSPDWYGLADQVPTWNYVAVHLTGSLEQRPQDELLGLLDRQSAFYEARLLPKPPWHSDKMEPEALERMMRMIVPVRLSIETVEGTWKLSQNKPEPARTAVADQITTGFGAELDDLARMMRS
ncbi:FMN-binding negative transcriptional regulator [Pseudophaeobacter sp. C1-32P7]|uniref:FMN-binding negative transcriptional regulator n=1 Tax=Pseudophaeobacter sp. C1-32P7 TaxID=3098142 RepID=UPI0034D5033D